MSKIVILASTEDAEAASAALTTAGLDFDVVEPTAANLLHLVIGMVDDGEEKPKKEPKEPKEPKEEPTEEPPVEEPAEEPPVEEVPEELGTAVVDGEVIQAIKGGTLTSTLFARSVMNGAKTTYTLAESTFSFWPADVKAPAQRMNIEHNKHRTSVEVFVQESKKSYPYLVVGADLEHLFKSK